MKWKKKEVGFTLFEIIVAVAISIVIGGLILSMLTQNNGVFLKQSAKVSQGLSINNASNEIYESIKAASAVVSQYPLAGQAQYISDNQSLVLAVPSVNASGSVIDGSFDYAVFVKDSQKPKVFKKYLYPAQNSARKSENMVLSTSLSLVKFSYFDSNNLTVSPSSAARIEVIINQSDKVGLETEVSSSSSTINLRNN